MPIQIPFLNFFRKIKDQALAGSEPAIVARKTVSLVEKPTADRFSKTVMPNATRSLSPQESFASLGRSSPLAGASSPPRTVAVGATAPIPRPSDLPPAVALAL